MAETPFIPVRKRMAINSEFLSASAPWAASRSRGRSLSGRSLMRMLALIGEDDRQDGISTRGKKRSRKAPSAKLQHPENHQAHKLQCRRFSSQVIWIFMFDYSLELGCWCLKLP